MSMFASIIKRFSGSSEDLAEDVKLPPSDVKLPLKETNVAASPASTCAPEGSPFWGASPGASSTPGTNLATPERRAGDSEYPTPFLDKSAFLATPSGDRFGSPPGLASGNAAKVDADGGAAEGDEAGPEASPTAQPKQLWPNTMSGDTLEAMIAGAGGPVVGTPKKGVHQSPAASPTAALIKPNAWPRTFSGDDMDIGDFMASLPAVCTSQAQAQAQTSPRTSPVSSPKVCPTMWPRTGSGEDLEELLSAAQEVLGAAKQGTPNSKMFLSTTPSAKKDAPLQAPQLPISKSADTSASPPSAPPAAKAPVFEEEATPPPPEAPAASPDAKKVSIMDSLPEVEVGTEERPTVGSWGHSVGKCKPCAFNHTKGCTNGQDCPFCHLCGRGEKKRRQREKWQRVREEEAVVAHVQAAAHHAAIMMSPLVHAPMSPLVGTPMPGLLPMPMPPMMPGFGMSPSLRTPGAY